MGFNYRFRREQLDMLAWEISLAYQEAQGDPHLMIHTFQWYLGNRSVEQFLRDVDTVLIPNLQQSPEWCIIIPDVLETVSPLRCLDFIPRIECRYCW